MPLKDETTDDILVTPARYWKEMLIFLQTGLSCCEGLPEGLRAAIQEWIDFRMPRLITPLDEDTRKALHSMTWVLVNGKKIMVADGEPLKYEDIIRLSGLRIENDPIVVLRDVFRDRTLSKGESVPAAAGMIFYVTILSED